MVSDFASLLRRLYARLDDDRLLAVAGGVVFFGLLALFPALTAFVSLYGMIADTWTLDTRLSMLSGILPGGAVEILHDEVVRLVARGGATLSFGFVAGLAFAFWSANSGVKAIIDSLNVAYGVKETRSFVRLNLVATAFTLGGILGLTVVIGAVVAAPIVLSFVGLGEETNLVIRIARWPSVLLVVLVGLEALYRWAPCRGDPRWRLVSAGGVAATILWLVASVLFSWYIANFGHYGVTYGSLGAAIGMMMWMWISMIVILLGAEINADIEAQAGTERS